MTRKPVVFITGAGGEIGHGLISTLAQDPDRAIITLDLNPLHPELRPLVRRHVVGSILDANLLETLQAEYEIDLIVHLAALLSTRSEFTPKAAHRINVEGTMALLEFAQEQGESHGRPVVFLYPSSIAAYGLPSVAEKTTAGKVREDDYSWPTTMYGCNKLYCEMLGIYYSRHYRQLAAEAAHRKVDFRCLRFPGLISAVTVPSGGTSDYAPEMLHAAAQGKPYACFVRPDTRIPFMAMPDAITAILSLSSASREQLTRPVYNISAFNPSAEEIRQIVMQEFPGAVVDFKLDAKRQGIVDSWPEDVDDSAARADWGFRPKYDLNRAFREYLIPTIKGRYAQ
ncbi:MAG: NAD-dependent epimerase/dehydratase family protein [Gemmataceae bacterium]|nr:NAD-dependent epimerase/dehydratase family protein [Gemmataceae bacterium]